MGVILVLYAPRKVLCFEAENADVEGKRNSKGVGNSCRDADAPFSCWEDVSRCAAVTSLSEVSPVMGTGVFGELQLHLSFASVLYFVFSKSWLASASQSPKLNVSVPWNIPPVALV